jgi:hypothetical protein
VNFNNKQNEQIIIADPKPEEPYSNIQKYYGVDIQERFILIERYIQKTIKQLIATILKSD